jgi:hypothetical protein
MAELQNRKQADAYRFLMAAVIDRAIDDLQGKGPKCRRAAETDQAMAFILGETCEAYCLELKIDCERIREKAVGLYQRFIEKNDKETVKRKRAKKPIEPLTHVQIRKITGKRRTGTGK